MTTSATPSSPARRWRQLGVRVGIGALLLGALAGAFLVERSLTGPGEASTATAMFLSAAILAALAAAGGVEACRLLVAIGIPASARTVAPLAAGYLLWLLPWPHVPPAAAELWLALGFVAPLIACVLVDRGADAPRRALGNAVALFYVPWLLGFLVRIRALEDGLDLLFAVVLCTKASDIFAYFSGWALGRHKAIPRISPGKTWEGYVGGALGALAAGWFLLVAPAQAGTTSVGVLAAGLTVVAITVLAPLGDLVESLLKRAAASKDSSRLLPEFGGVLDLIDSLLVTAPAAYAILAAGQ